MSHVTLDEATRQKLGVGSNGGKVELRDEAGRVIGYLVSPEKMQSLDAAREFLLDWAEKEFPPEMREAARNDPRPRRTMAEVLRHFGCGDE
jgi:hypothetical protein